MIFLFSSTNDSEMMNTASKIMQLEGDKNFSTITAKLTFLPWYHAEFWYNRSQITIKLRQIYTIIPLSVERQFNINPDKERHNLWESQRLFRWLYN